MRAGALTGIAGICAVWVSAGTFAGPDEPLARQHARLLAAQPAGAQFSIRLTDGRDRYRLGEPIPVRFEFTGGDRWVSEDTRPHQTNWDWFVAEAIDGGELDDAMSALLSLDMAPYLGCGNVDVKRGALAIDTFVNEWLRFHQPGRYRFFVRSFRLGATEVVSNAIEVSIVPADAGDWWRLMAQWHAGGRAEAARGIRYAGTSEATRFMTDHLGEGEHFGQSLGNAPTLETLRGLPQTHETSGLVAFHVLRLVAPLRLSYGPDRYAESGWRRMVRERARRIYHAAFYALEDWLSGTA